MEDNKVMFLCTESAFRKTWLPPELQRVLSCESPAVFLHFPLEEKGPWGTFYQLWRVIAKGRCLLQILLKALYLYKLWWLVVKKFIVVLVKGRYMRDLILYFLAFDSSSQDSSAVMSCMSILFNCKLPVINYLEFNGHITLFQSYLVGWVCLRLSSWGEWHTTFEMKYCKGHTFVGNFPNTLLLPYQVQICCCVFQAFDWFKS